MVLKKQIIIKCIDLCVFFPRFFEILTKLTIVDYQRINQSTLKCPKLSD
jgi:hypothetical protein